MSLSFKKIIKSLITNIGYEPIRKHRHITKASSVLELEYGHYNSVVKQRALNKYNKPIPWFTYPAIDYLDQLDLSQRIMLEWGAGNSSLFFSGLVKKIYSIEHDEEWFKNVKELGISNHDLRLVPVTQYAANPRDLNMKFDIILIDGIEREGCADVAIELLHPDGFIILDNSERHPDIAEKLRSHDLIQIDFHGFGPINNYTWTTSLFLTRSVAFSPIGRQPKIPAGGGY
jgi:hypothetical protein